MNDYDVVIVGGGPVGLALGIELGLSNIKTLILEKYSAPLQAVRAQSLSARTMELMLRWGIDKQLERNVLLPLDFPQEGIWCSSFCGEVYHQGLWGDNDLPKGASPKSGLRVPLWVTEEVMRKRVRQFESVDFRVDVEAIDISIRDNVDVTYIDRKCAQHKHIVHCQYVACCDGSNGFTKTQFGNTYRALSSKSRILDINFLSSEIYSKKQVPDAIFYWIFSGDLTAFIGPVSLEDNRWFAQVIWKDGCPSPSKASLSLLLDQAFGQHFAKEILSFHFWDMQVRIAGKFSHADRVFWLGDSAHAFAPTGAQGLNTGFVDAVNLGWKLAHQIKAKSTPKLLQSYDKERGAICKNNLSFSNQCADKMLALKKSAEAVDSRLEFSRKMAKLGGKFLRSSGLTMGYRYPGSQWIVINDETVSFAITEYKPIFAAGYFLPHFELSDGASIYSKLSPAAWTLLVNGDVGSLTAKVDGAIDVMHVIIPVCQANYLLVRPDWHIALASSSIQSLQEFICLNLL